MSHERRVFVELTKEVQSVTGIEVTLSDTDSHHLVRVLRLPPGSPVKVVLKPSGEEYEGLITNASMPVRVKLIRACSDRGEGSRVQSLAFALTKGPRSDLVCEKACELGVRQIIFWQASRSVVRITSEEDRQKKLARWLRIAESAAKQSAKPYIPEVIIVQDNWELLGKLDEIRGPLDCCLCCSLSPSAIAIREIPAPRGRVHVVVGPEGDLTPEEEETFLTHGFQLVSLGPYVLRSETAAIAAVAMVEAL